MGGLQIPAARACRLGLFDEVVEPDELEKLTYEFAETVCTRAQFSVRAGKQMVNKVVAGQVEDDDATTDLRNSSFDTEDFAEGVRAFMEKRSPRFGVVVTTTGPVLDADAVAELARSAAADRPGSSARSSSAGSCGSGSATTTPGELPVVLPYSALAQPAGAPCTAASSRPRSTSRWDTSARGTCRPPITIEMQMRFFRPLTSDATCRSPRPGRPPDRPPRVPHDRRRRQARRPRHRLIQRRLDAG